LEPKLCNKEHRCADCGDKLIHQFHRGYNESSSAFGQFLHDEVTKRTSIVDADHQFIDGYQLETLDSQIHQLHFGLGTQRLRVLEHKPTAGVLSQAQKWILVAWRRLIYLGIKDGHIGMDSGVFTVEADPPFDKFVVTKYPELEIEPKTRHMSRDQFTEWMGGAR
jgi:hypothetical protein